MACIYMITNTENGKAYIGQTKNDAKTARVNRHLNGDGSRLIKQAIDKYGIDAFAWEILEDSIIPEMIETYEINAIKKYNTITPNGYNLTSGGEFYTHSEETKRKISESWKYRVVTDETRRKQSEAKRGSKHPNYGKPMSEEQKKKLSDAKRGRKLTEQHKRKISEGLKATGRKMSEENKRKLYIANKGRRLTNEHKRKISESTKGEKSVWYGKRHTEETKKRMSESQCSPERKKSREYYLTLPIGMTLSEKRKRVMEFSGKGTGTVWKWVKAWENESKT